MTQKENLRMSQASTIIILKSNLQYSSLQARFPVLMQEAGPGGLLRGGVGEQPLTEVSISIYVPTKKKIHIGVTFKDVNDLSFQFDLP